LFFVGTNMTVASNFAFFLNLLHITICVYRGLYFMIMCVLGITLKKCMC